MRDRRKGKVELPIRHLNHAVLYVRDLSSSVSFYTSALAFRDVTSVAGVSTDRPSGKAFLQAPDSSNDHDLALFEVGRSAAESLAGRGAVGLYHLGWEVDTLEELGRLQSVLARHGALVGASDHGTSKSIYGLDPDGIEFEIAWLLPAHLLEDDARLGRLRTQPLDLHRAKGRYGATTVGGIGVSHRT